MSIKRILDSHVHFIDPTQLNYSWIKAVPKLQRGFAPAEYRAATAALPITDLIFVEAGADPAQSLVEVEWGDCLRADEPRLRAMVARAPLTDVSRRQVLLERLAAKGNVVGIRDSIQGEAHGYCTQQSYIDGVNLASKLGLAIELCVSHPQLADVIELVNACPKARFMLNHCGKPGIRDHLLDPWRDLIRTLAKAPNVSCKISALLTEADLERWKPEDFTPYLDHVVECFGPRRVLYGGDWPVLTLAGSYRDWLGLTETMTRTWSEPDRDHYYYANARDFYKLGSPT